VTRSHLQLVTEPAHDDRPSLTAGQLREALADHTRIPDDAHVYLALGDLWAFPVGNAWCFLLGTPGEP
jgi:hypothetical protein